MIIDRIQIEEGFLEGLDLSFRNGLNVLIGPRGVGKTSVIELLRFCLGAPALTDNANQTSKEHALSILGSGRVTVTLNDGNSTFSISRTAEQWIKSSNFSFIPPLILSQNEIESVGLHSIGRLRLLDSIHPGSFRTLNNDKENTLLSYIRSNCEEHRAISTELHTIRIQTNEISEQLKEAAHLKTEHANALKSIEMSTKDTNRLALLAKWSAALAVRSSVYERTLSALQQWRNKLVQINKATIDLEVWPSAASCDDTMTLIRGLVKESQDYAQAALVKTDEAIKHLVGLSDRNALQSNQYEEESRTIRRKLDSLKHGAGETARRLAVLQEKAGQLSALQALEKSKIKRLEQVHAERKLNLDRLEEIRNLRFEERSKLVKQLNNELGPRIKISIERAGQTSEYASAIVAALRGSGLRFNEVAPTIADQMSPREFIEAVETENIDTLSEITGISPARAAKIIERINDQGVEEILTASVEDNIELSLLDGIDYKATDQLSTGQRCTVILPLLLKQRNLSLIVDQPEDHLDNAFIVDTLIKAIAQRKIDGQMIFSTHNANIPVLGEADSVMLLGSDGSRGYLVHKGNLNDPNIVNAITTVMEGGLEAFDRRFNFYHGIL